ncbi:MAG: hypothetical protein GQ570_14855 [Helicobacteraceae bacterium]|nr:hypothetical protein [Helicobacteraceae bacterium]
MPMYKNIKIYDKIVKINYKDLMMMIIGAHGTKSKDSSLSTFLIDNETTIDAGNLIDGLGEEFLNVNSVFITHSHLDHIVDLPLIIDTMYDKLKHSINVYATAPIIKALKDHMFNNIIWPDFSMIPLIGTSDKVIVYHEIEYDKEYKTFESTLTPFKNNHMNGSCGFIINNKVMLTSDTYKCDRIWEILNENKKIDTLIIEISFSSDLNGLAEASKHLTPSLLKEELTKLKRDDVHIYINHIKESSYHKIVKEIKELNLNVEILDNFVCIANSKATV